MQNLIIKWLQTKINFIYSDFKKDLLFDDSSQFNDLLITSRVHYQDLSSSDCYIVENNLGNIKYDLQKAQYYEYDYVRFNEKINEYIFDIISHVNICKNLSSNNAIQKKATILQFINELDHAYVKKNKFLDTRGNLSYKNIFHDINKDNVKEYKNVIIESLKQKSLDLDDFATEINKMQKYYKGLNGIGVFYPFIFSHDILDDKYYLCEINQYRFQRKKTSFFNIVNKFYTGYHVNNCRSIKLFPLEFYFIHPGLDYSESFAYFDPLKSYDKYKKEYKLIKSELNKNKQDYKSFFMELFNFFNDAQFDFVIFQHRNLIKSLYNLKSNNKLYTFRDLIDREIDKINTNYDSSQFKYLVTLLFLKHQPSNILLNKNTKIDDLQNIKNLPPLYRNKVQELLYHLTEYLNKNKESTLKYIYDEAKENCALLLKKYKIKSKHQKIIYDMLLDLILFYKDKNEKLSKPYNCTIEEIFQKYQKRNISTILDFDFPVKFIKQYNEYFNQYKPFEFKDENGKKKFMYT